MDYNGGMDQDAEIVEPGEDPEFEGALFTARQDLARACLAYLHADTGDAEEGRLALMAAVGERLADCARTLVDAVGIAQPLPVREQVDGYHLARDRVQLLRAGLSWLRAQLGDRSLSPDGYDREQARTGRSLDAAAVLLVWTLGAKT